MNFSEFKKMLGAEPRGQDPEFLIARNSSAEFSAAAREAIEFEEKLEAALRVAAPRNLLDRIEAIPASAALAKQPRWTRLAAAAAVVAGVGVASVTWYESTFYWENVDDYVVEHWHIDGPDFLDLADGSPDANAAALFARYGVEISPALAESIDYIHACRTPGSRGAHMVIDTDQGPVTLIFMPEVETVDGHILAFENLVAATLPLERGSAVIIGPNEDIIAPIYAMARDGIRPVSQTT